MLRDEMKLYTKLTGEDAAHVPIMKIGAYLDGYEKGLSDKPSGKWIPTSETMPDNPSEDVLVCDIDGDIYKAYLSDYDGWKRSEDFEKVKSVIAWQPLPAPYKMESENNE